MDDGADSVACGRSDRPTAISTKLNIDFRRSRIPGMIEYCCIFAVDPSDKDRMFAASHLGDILANTDGGASCADLGC